MVYTKELIEKLISCPKRIIEPPKKEMVLYAFNLARFPWVFRETEVPISTIVSSALLR